jgi:uncharacterized protein YehS (DUF1456 family)
MPSELFINIKNLTDESLRYTLKISEKNIMNILKNLKVSATNVFYDHFIRFIRSI